MIKYKDYTILFIVLIILVLIFINVELISEDSGLITSSAIFSSKPILKFIPEEQEDKENASPKVKIVKVRQPKLIPR